MRIVKRSTISYQRSEAYDDGLNTETRRREERGRTTTFYRRGRWEAVSFQLSAVGPDARLLPRRDIGIHASTRGRGRVRWPRWPNIFNFRGRGGFFSCCGRSMGMGRIAYFGVVRGLWLRRSRAACRPREPRWIARVASGFRHPASTWEGEQLSAMNAVLFSPRTLRRRAYLLVSDRRRFGACGQAERGSAASR